ncbi:MAG: DUF3302 domain-containing protein [bacterium]|nr:DUF3302 domain-containing protein [bacterium]
MEYQFESLGPAMRWIVLIFLLLFVVGLVAAAAGVAALPGWAARRRGHPQAAAINVCGWFGLPTGILWVVAIVWAYLKVPVGSTAELPASPSMDLGRLRAQVERLESAVSTLEESSK